MTSKRKIILFIATSLDGYIARADGSIDWLFTDADYGYREFYASIDTTLMGRKTYEQVRTMGPFPYPEKHNYVFTHQRQGEDEHVTFVNKDAVGFIRDLKAQDGGDIWLIGGGGLIQTCLQDQLIDELRIFIHPVILGEGLPLIPSPSPSVNMEVIRQGMYDNGLVEVHYHFKY